MQSMWLVKKLINCSCFSSFQTKNWKTYCISHQNLSWFSCFYFVWRQKLNCIKAKATVLYESVLISICTMYEYVGKVFLYICVYDWRNKNIEKKALQCNKNEFKWLWNNSINFEHTQTDSLVAKQIHTDMHMHSMYVYKYVV